MRLRRPSQERWNDFIAGHLYADGDVDSVGTAEVNVHEYDFGDDDFADEEYNQREEGPAYR